MDLIVDYPQDSSSCFADLLSHKLAISLHCNASEGATSGISGRRALAKVCTAKASVSSLAAIACFIKNAGLSHRVAALNVANMRPMRTSGAFPAWRTTLNPDLTVSPLLRAHFVSILSLFNKSEVVDSAVSTDVHFKLSVDIMSKSGVIE